MGRLPVLAGKLHRAKAIMNNRYAVLQLNKLQLIISLKVTCQKRHAGCRFLCTQFTRRLGIRRPDRQKRRRIYKSD